MVTFAQLALAFPIFAIVYWSLERLFPSVPGYKLKTRPGMIPDVVYFMIGPTIFQAMKIASTIAVVFLWMKIDPTLTKDNLLTGRGPISNLPTSVEFVLGVLVFDFFVYCAHYFLHRGWLWKVHSVHHSSVQLDWLSSTRSHPFDDMFRGLFVVPLMIILGFNLGLVAIAFTGGGLLGILNHSNIRVTFGPLEHVIATPKFHRWHHTSEELGLDKNFATVFTFWDRLFGTFYNPKEFPQEFGLFGEEIKENIFSHLIHPFKN